MTSPCPQCGFTADFEVPICPRCGARIAGNAPKQDSNRDADPDRWEKTVFDSEYTPRRGTRGRARFGGRGNFYEPITGDSTIRDTGLAFDSDDDRTIIERGDADHDDDGDSTIIVRDGKRGVQGPLVYVVERNGVRAGKVHLVGVEADIGRAADNDIVIANDSVSKRHAKIRLENGSFMFWDLASANYSFVIQQDGSRKRILEPYALKDGDTMELGEARVTFIEVDRATLD